MFAKRSAIQPMVEPPVGPVRSGGAVDHVAAASAVMVIGLGVMQLAAPFFTSPLTGMEAGTGGTIIAVQWIVFGAILATGGLLRMRVVTMFAAEFLLIAGVVAAIVTMLGNHEPIPLLVHGAIAFVGLTNAGLARLTDSADLKRELRLAKESARMSREDENSVEETNGAPHA
ncbi:hypothetical protein [Erythrobacter sp. JK5]|uniref:hypothetical protein n=1 Tax=Erythrobacter sp. JK5 TaxID=2829500 RepID=UPI001BAD6D8F|nr:hypothetical protein [Erythrobacter sp. JK5]QUL38360.1 hypothetical protein KDC96_02795 [Erythrobacter sp. JK5]